MTRETLKELVDNYTCYYDGVSVVEFHEDVLYTDCVDEYKFEDLDFNYFYAYELEEYEMSFYLKDFVKIVDKCKKELNRFENGRDFFGIVKNEFELYQTEESLDELFNLYELPEVLNSLQYIKFNRVKVKEENEKDKG